MSAPRTSHSLTAMLILLGAVSRLLPHPPNVVPIGALAIFGGLYLPRPWSAIVPFLSMFLSDVIIGFYDWRIMAVVYACFLCGVFIGEKMKNNKKIPVLLGGATLSALIFFLATNAAVWVFGSLYPHTFSGLFQSYAMAIPFFRNSLIGDIFYMSILIAVVEISAKFLIFGKSNIAGVS
ncbi:MAG: hypothetical protein HY984_01065 [Candidatus Magasanikbacteria bacterium]|nr:hypothetical protein [Candidatus Magasanikbacteria bacterium]